jgi:hypothetical protein
MSLMTPNQLNRASTATTKVVGSLAKKLPPPSVPKVATVLEKVAARYGLTPAQLERLALSLS